MTESCQTKIVSVYQVRQGDHTTPGNEKTRVIRECRMVREHRLVTKHKGGDRIQDYQGTQGD